MKKKVNIYKGFERFWHWSQAILILFLAFTGFEVHGSYKFFGYENAAIYHQIAAYSYIVLVIFTIFWHFTTGEWRQYIPTWKNIKAQVSYYLFGIFKNAQHPTKKTELSKLNPLQKLTYLGLKLLVIPVMVTTGLLYIFYRYPQSHRIETINIDSLQAIAFIHTLGAYLLVAFIIMHLYLITTGSTVTSNLKAMLTGYEDIDADDEKDKNKEKEVIQEEIN